MVLQVSGERLKVFPPTQNSPDFQKTLRRPIGSYPGVFFYCLKEHSEFGNQLFISYISLLNNYTYKWRGTCSKLS